VKRWLPIFLLAGLSLLAARSTPAQGGFASGISWRYTPAGAFPFGNAAITVCTSSATGIPCAPTVSLFSDALLTMPVANPLPQCTFTPQFGCIDNLGNFSFYVAFGTYTYTVSGAGITPYGPIPINATGPGNFSGTVVAGQNVYGTGPNALGSSPNFLWNQGSLTATLFQTTLATAGANQSAPQFIWSGNYWNGAASAADTWTCQPVLGAGANPTTVLTCSHSGSSGTAEMLVPFISTGGIQITNGASVNQIQTNASGGSNAINLAVGNPAFSNMFIGAAAGNPIQLFWRNAPWSTSEVDLTAQNAIINATTLASPPLFAGATQYRISWNAKVTTPAGASSTLGPLTITYVDPDGTTQTITAAAQSNAGAIETSDAGNVTTTLLLGVPMLINTNNASNSITYAFGYASNAGGVMHYNLHIRIEAVQ
jgi:hypothetical protein